jgi:hypothetical protein
MKSARLTTGSFRAARPAQAMRDSAATAMKKAAPFGAAF